MRPGSCMGAHMSPFLSRIAVPSGGPRVHLGPETGTGPHASALQRGPRTKTGPSGRTRSQASSDTEPGRATWSLGRRGPSRAPQRHRRTTRYSVTCQRKSSWEPTSKPRRFWKPRLEHSKELLQMLASGNCFVYKVGVWGQRQPSLWGGRPGTRDTAGGHGRI